MKEIKLTQNQTTVVDDGDFDYLNQWKWYAHKEGKSYYAVRKSKRENGKQKMIYMHTALIGTSGALKHDHIDRNTLNNQRENLRFATNSQNAINRPIQPNNSVGFKGVHRANKKFRAIIVKDGEFYCSKSKPTPKEAAEEYDRMAKELFGNFACLNFPDL